MKYNAHALQIKKLEIDNNIRLLHDFLSSGVEKSHSTNVSARFLGLTSKDINRGIKERIVKDKNVIILNFFMMPNVGFTGGASAASDSSGTPC